MRGVSCLLWMTVIDLWKQKSARPRLNRDSSHRLEVHFPLIDPRLSSSLVANCARPTLGVTSDNNEFIFPPGTLKKFYSLKLPLFFLEKFFLIHQMANLIHSHLLSPHLLSLLSPSRQIQQLSSTNWPFKRQTFLYEKLRHSNVLLKCWKWPSKFSSLPKEEIKIHPHRRR